MLDAFKLLLRNMCYCLLLSVSGAVNRDAVIMLICQIPPPLAETEGGSVDTTTTGTTTQPCVVS